VRYVLVLQTLMQLLAMIEVVFASIRSVKPETVIHVFFIVVVQHARVPPLCRKNEDEGLMGGEWPRGD